MSEIPPELPTKAEKLVQSSLVLAVLSIICGITALPAIFQSIRALLCLRKTNASKAAFGKVIFSLIFSTSILSIMVSFLVSALSSFHASGADMRCTDNMKILGIEARIYETDNNDRLLPANWCDVLLTNNIGASDYSLNISEKFRCPSAPKKQRCSYAMNRQLVGIKNTDEVAQDTVMLFESDAGWNAVGGVEILSSRHSGLNVALADGSVREIPAKDIPNLRWNPYAKTPAK